MWGLIGAIDGLLWAWAIDKWILGGVVIGFVIAGLVGAYVGLVVGAGTMRDQRRATTFGAGAMLGLPTLVIGLLAIIVKVVRWAI